MNIQEIAEERYPTNGETGRDLLTQSLQKEAFIAGAELDRWVSVEKEMPEKTGAYLVLCNDGEMRIAKVAVNGWWTELHGGYYGDMNVNGTNPNREVTHWQYLPALPSLSKTQTNG